MILDYEIYYLTFLIYKITLQKNLIIFLKLFIYVMQIFIQLKIFLTKVISFLILNSNMISKITQNFFNLSLKYSYGTTPQMMHDLSAAFLLD